MPADLPLTKKVGQGALGLLGAAAEVPRGLFGFLRTPSLWLLGAIPVALSAALVLAGAVALVAWVVHGSDLHHLSFWLWLLAVPLYCALALVAFLPLVGVVAEPFYDRIAARVDPSPVLPEAPWWKRMPVASAEALLLTVAWLLCSALFLLLGLLPGAGQTVIPAMYVVVSGFFLALESMRIPLYRRGVRRLKERLGFAWRHRAETVGFGTTLFLLILPFPPLALILVPGALVGATGLVRRLSDASASGGDAP